MKYAKSFSFFLLFLGIFSLAMNLYNDRQASSRSPASIERSDSAPWWMTY